MIVIVPVHNIDVKRLCSIVNNLLTIFAQLSEICWEDRGSDEYFFEIGDHDNFIIIFKHKSCMYSLV